MSVCSVVFAFVNLQICLINQYQRRKKALVLKINFAAKQRQIKIHGKATQKTKSKGDRIKFKLLKKNKVFSDKISAMLTQIPYYLVGFPSLVL